MSLDVVLKYLGKYGNMLGDKDFGHFIIIYVNVMYATL